MRSPGTVQTVSRILILAMLNLCWLTSTAWAGMVGTESAVQSQNASQIQTDRQRLLDLLQRQEVIDELRKYGISQVEVAARINSLTDAEVTRIAGKLDEFPEGGDGRINPFSDSFLMEVLLALVIVTVGVALYIPGFIFKAVECTVTDDCGGSEYLFRPWWQDVWGEEKMKEGDCDPDTGYCQ